MKDSDELINEPSMAEQERQVFHEFALAEAAKDEAARLHAKAARAQGYAEYFLDNAIRLSEALRRRKKGKPWVEGRTKNVISESRARKLLVKALGMLGSDRAGERANAALKVEVFRTKLGRTWEELIVQELEDLEDDEDEDDFDDDDDEEQTP